MGYSDPDNQDPKQQTDLNLVRGRSNKEIKGTSSQLGNLDTLLKWHCDNPVTNEERVRNDKIHGVWQGNRNPFVDYPGFVELIFGHTCPPESAHGAVNLNADGSSKVDKDDNTEVTVESVNSTPVDRPENDIDTESNGSSTSISCAERLSVGKNKYCDKKNHQNQMTETND